MDTLLNQINLPDNPLDEKNFHLLKINLSDKEGFNYINFKKKLTPFYKKVWIDIAGGWLSLIVINCISFFLIPATKSISFKIIIALLSSIIVGYIIAYLTNFFHEAAHFNIAKNKKHNDLLANIFVGILLGQSIKYYRIIHWEHHKNLGTPNDTETSYFESLNIKFILASLAGIRVLQIMLKRNNFIITESKKDIDAIKKEAFTQLLAGVIFHVLVLMLMVIFKQWWLMAIWVVAFGCFYPLFNSLRQLLEHRDDTASKNISYKTTQHGKLNRLFGNNFFDKTFGSAGFNKHLLHHLEPMISYTRLNELETFLKETILSKHLQNKRTSYVETFLKLFNK